MRGFILNIPSLFAAPFKKIGLATFFIHWMTWLALHFITFLPTLVNMTSITWEPFLFTHVVVVTLNFLLFYVVAFFCNAAYGKISKPVALGGDRLAGPGPRFYLWNVQIAGILERILAA